MEVFGTDLRADGIEQLDGAKEAGFARPIWTYQRSQLVALQDSILDRPEVLNAYCLDSHAVTPKTHWCSGVGIWGVFKLPRFAELYRGSTFSTPAKWLLPIQKFR